jgi:hypothetical protein
LAALRNCTRSRFRRWPRTATCTARRARRPSSLRGLDVHRPRRVEDLPHLPDARRCEGWRADAAVAVRRGRLAVSRPVTSTRRPARLAASGLSTHIRRSAYLTPRPGATRSECRGSGRRSRDVPARRFDMLGPKDWRA